MVLYEFGQTKLREQGWFIGHYMHYRTAYIMVAGAIVYLGHYESYLDAEKAINKTKECLLAAVGRAMVGSL
ncbi:hypothetical protein VKUWNCZY_CDS0071 [Escherichia phage KS_A8]